MKNIIIHTLAALSLVFATGISNVLAEERTITFEMGESGETVSFKMTSEEIAAEDAANARLETLRRANLDKPKKRVEKIELPESGVVLEFPMSAKEIQLAKAKEARASAKREAPKSARANDSDVVTEVVEMADGHTVTFTTTKGNRSESEKSWWSSLVRAITS